MPFAEKGVINMKEKNLRKIILVSLIAILVLFIFIFSCAYFFYCDQFKIYVDGMNSSAQAHYKVITSLTEYKDRLNVSEDSNFVIYGESYEYLSYTAYANEYLNEDTLFYGENNKQPTLYWAVKIVNGNISEIWSATFPLEEYDIHKYTFNEQLDAYRFGTKFKNIKVVGYYKSDYSNIIN